MNLSEMPLYARPQLLSCKNPNPEYLFTSADGRDHRKNEILFFLVVQIAPGRAERPLQRLPMLLGIA